LRLFTEVKGKVLEGSDEVGDVSCGPEEKKRKEKEWKAGQQLRGARGEGGGERRGTGDIKGTWARRKSAKTSAGGIEDGTSSNILITRHRMSRDRKMVKREQT